MTTEGESPNQGSGESAAQEPGPGAAPADAPPVADATPEQKLADAQALAARYLDQLKRTTADFDNFRKRTRREIEDAQRRGRETTVKDLLPVFDNLERAAAHADGTGDAKAVADGLRIVLKQFIDTLERMGIKRVPTVGQGFDPSIHEAIQHVDSDKPAGVIVHEVQAGYSLGDYLVRAAMVVVSKGPPAAEG